MITMSMGLRCDGYDKCDEHLTIGNFSPRDLEEAVDKIEERGWIVWGMGKTFCPRCARNQNFPPNKLGNGGKFLIREGM